MPPMPKEIREAGGAALLDTPAAPVPNGHVVPNGHTQNGHAEGQGNYGGVVIPDGFVAVEQDKLRELQERCVEAEASRFRLEDTSTTLHLWSPFSPEYF